MERLNLDYQKEIRNSILSPSNNLKELGFVKELKDQASALAAYKMAEALSRIFPIRWTEDKKSLWYIFLRRLKTRAGY